MINKSIINKFFKDFTNHRTKTIRAVVFRHRPLPTFLNTRNTRTTDETFHQSRKQDSFRHILNNSPSIYESTGLLFFRAITGIQSGPDAFNKSRLVMTFLSNLGVTGILFSFGLVLEGKRGIEIFESSRLEFLEKISANNISTPQDHYIVEIWPIYLC